MEIRNPTPIDFEQLKLTANKMHHRSHSSYIINNDDRPHKNEITFHDTHSTDTYEVQNKFTKQKHLTNYNINYSTSQSDQHTTYTKKYFNNGHHTDPYNYLLNIYHLITVDG